MKTLALSTKVQNGVKPPAKKHEVIAAMAQVKLQQLQAEKEALNTAWEKAEKDAQDALTAHVRENLSKLTVESSIGYNSCDGSVKCLDAKVSLIFENLPKAVQRLVQKAHQAKDNARSVRIPDFHSIKRQIAAAMVGETTPDLRVKALVETPETRKAIEKMLAALEAPAPAINI